MLNYYRIHTVRFQPRASTARISEPTVFGRDFTKPLWSNFDWGAAMTAVFIFFHLTKLTVRYYA